MFISRMVYLCSGTTYMMPHLHTFLLCVHTCCRDIIQCVSLVSQQLNLCPSVYLSIEAILLFVATRPANGIN